MSLHSSALAVSCEAQPAIPSVAASIFVHSRQAYSASVDEAVDADRPALQSQDRVYGELVVRRKLVCGIARGNVAAIVIANICKCFGGLLVEGNRRFKVG